MQPHPSYKLFARPGRKNMSSQSKEKNAVFSARTENVSYGKLKPKLSPDPHVAPRPASVKRKPPGRWYYLDLHFRAGFQQVKINKNPLTLGTTWRMYQDTSEKNSPHLYLEEDETIETPEECIYIVIDKPSQMGNRLYDMYLHDKLSSTEACVALKGVSLNKLVIFTLESQPSNKRRPLKKLKRSTGPDCDENPANKEKLQNDKPEASHDAIPEELKKTTKPSDQNPKFVKLNPNENSLESISQSLPTKQPNEEAMDVLSTGPTIACNNDVTLEETSSRALSLTGENTETGSVHHTADDIAYKLPPTPESSIVPEASNEDTVAIVLESEATPSQLDKQDRCSDTSSSCVHSETSISSNLQSSQERCSPIKVGGNGGGGESAEEKENESDSDASDEFYEAREAFSDHDD